MNPPPALPASPSAWPRNALRGLIWLYQRTASPLLSLAAGPGGGCRFAPTCSHYAAEAVRVHGILRGAGLAALRLAKCTPLHPGGLDPVPPARPPGPFRRG